MEKRSLIISAVLHGVILLIILFGAPISFKRSLPPTPHIVTVELLPISEITNVKPQRNVTKKPEKKPEKKVEEKKEVKPTPKPIAKPKPKPKPKVKPKPPPAPKKQAEKKPLPRPEKKPEPKKEEPQPEESLDFESVLKSVKQLEEDAPQEKMEFDPEQLAKELSPAQSDDFKPGLPMTMSEKEAIRQQIMRNWNVQSIAGAKDAGKVFVVLLLTLDPDGTVKQVTVVKKQGPQPQILQSFADSAERAANRSSPLQGLPTEKYDTKDGWREIELTFNLAEML